MEINPMVAMRAMLVGGVAVFAKVAGALKAAGGVKVGTAAAAAAAAAAAMSGSKGGGNKEAPSQQGSK
ncbi:hypothetical protein LUZ61_012747 [Rhynchospora tenuis]|uniref:Uncharacterized protein n=1 Tax=Rhynchospora tenuis TaxID=198213 RepID=A0AAD6A3J3_9POAL|nr:hypothetical protein LUZ61_012747 [Rhynchospora tenuis]